MNTRTWKLDLVHSALPWEPQLATALSTSLYLTQRRVGAHAFIGHMLSIWVLRSSTTSSINHRCSVQLRSTNYQGWSRYLSSTKYISSQVKILCGK